MSDSPQDRAAPLSVPLAASLEALLAAPPRVVNIGLEGFARDLALRGAAVIHVAWQPPAGGDAELADLLARLGG